MKQRLGLASALLGEPPILILDEPTNGLDPAGIHEIRNLVKSLPKRYDCTVLISSHMLSEIELLADDIGILNHGRLLFEGSLEDLKFIAENLSDSEFVYSLPIQGLLATGLVMQTTYSFEPDGVQKYNFTPLAKLIDCYALSYGHVNRYPNPKDFELSSVPPLASKTARTVEMLQEKVSKQPAQQLVSSKESTPPTENGAINWIYD